MLAVAHRFREYASKPRLRERRGGAGDAGGVLDHGGGSGSDAFQSADRHHQRGLLSGQETRGLNRQLSGIREPEVFIEAARQRRLQMGMAIDEAGEQSFSA